MSPCLVWHDRGCVCVRVHLLTAPFWHGLFFILKLGHLYLFLVLKHLF